MKARETGERAAGLGKAAAIGGAVLVALALWFGEARVTELRAPEPLGPNALRELARSRLQVAAVGALLLVAGLALAWRRPRLARRKGVARAAVVAGAVLLPLFLLERGLRPFVERPTRIFQPDDELGWRLAPGVADDWLGVPTRINAQGMRGPLRERPKPPGTLRVLLLGDSVTFGAFIGEDGATIPAQVERRLDEALPARVECLNAGVGGYSPWQDLAQLRELAPLFEPDLVVLDFILNDVTEKLDLARFGGPDEGFQLTLRREPGLSGWLRSLAVVQYAMRRGARRHETMSVYELLLRPNDDAVQAAWELTLESLDGIVAWCRERGLPLLVVAYPHAAQLQEPARNAPQWILQRFTGRRGVPYLDLLPPVVQELERSGLDESALYVDGLHPNERGCEVMAGLISERILEVGLLGEEDR